MASANRLPRRRRADESELAYQAAELAFARAEYPAARRLLELTAQTTREDRARVAILDARLAHIEHDEERSYREAVRAGKDHPTSGGRVHARALQLRAAKRIGKTTEAVTLREQVEFAVDGLDPQAAAPAVYLLAQDAWEDGDLDRAEAFAERNRKADASVAQSVALLGSIEIRRERYARAVKHFLRALRSLEATGEIDVALQAGCVVDGLALANETLDLPLAQRFGALAEEIPWTPHLAGTRRAFLSERHLTALLSGDLIEAWSLARDAVGVAGAKAAIAIAETEAAAASLLVGDRNAHRIQLERAWSILRGERWVSADAEARRALTTFAAEASTALPVEARKALILHAALTAKAGPPVAPPDDRRTPAFELLAHARVAEASRDRKRAIELSERAAEIFTDIGYDLHAALVALDLRRLTGDAAYAVPVRAALKRVPKAWFAKELRAEATPLARLSAAERVVLGYLLRGQSAKAIASELDRSHYTIINHTRKIFLAFGVNSRARVIARCIELGITAESVAR